VGSPSVGQLQALLEEASAACRVAYAEVQAAMRGSAAVGVDETSWYLRGRSYWLGAAATERLSFYHLDKRRSGWARERLLGRSYAGIVLSDRLGAYNGLPPPQRQLCWAHLLRDFADWQSYGGRVEALAREAERCAQELFEHWHGYLDVQYDRAELERRLGPLQERLRACLEEGRACSVSRIRKNCKQLLALWPALWTFARHRDVEPTNNETERTLRAGVIWRKTSFGSPSGRGLRLVERFLTVAETCKKQGRDLLGFLTTSLQAHHGAGPYPRLLPTP
jgi:transposase